MELHIEQAADSMSIGLLADVHKQGLGPPVARQAMYIAVITKQIKVPGCPVSQHLRLDLLSGPRVALQLAQRLICPRQR